MTQRHIRSAAGWGPRIWAKIYYPQVLTILTVTGYLTLIPGWSSALLNMPRSFDGSLGEVAMYMVAVLILIGSIIGVPTALVGEYRVEKTAVIAVVAGLLMYSGITYGLHITSEMGNRLPSGSTIMYAAIISTIRFWWLHNHRKLLREGLLPRSRDKPAES